MTIHVDLARARRCQRGQAQEHRLARKAIARGDTLAALKHQYNAWRFHDPSWIVLVHEQTATKDDQ